MVRLRIRSLLPPDPLPMIEGQTDVATPVDRAVGQGRQVREDREEEGKADVHPRKAGRSGPGWPVLGRAAGPARPPSSPPARRGGLHHSVAVSLMEHQGGRALPA